MRFTKLCSFTAYCLLFCSTVHAEVIYSGLKNLPITKDGFGTSLNLISGEVSNGAPGPSGDWDFNVFFTPQVNPTHPWGLSLNKQEPILGNDFGAALAGHYSGEPFNIPLTQIYNVGIPIGPGSDFLDQLDLNPGVFTAPFGTAILGLRLFSFDDLDFHYAWIRLTLDGPGNGYAQGKIVDWAYESSANTALLSGLPLSVPEPSSLVTGMMGLATVAAARLVQTKRRCCQNDRTH